MPTSKSGIIRKSIGSRKARLKTIIAAGADYNNSAATVDAADTLTLQNLIRDIENTIAKLDTSVGNLKEQEKEWVDLMKGLPDEEVQFEEGVYNRYVDAEDSYMTVMDDGLELANILRMSLQRLQRRPEEAAQRGTAGADAAGGGERIETRRTNTAKLPKLVLPQFSGDHLLWSQFWAIFKTNIDDTDLQGVEKLAFLRGQLTGVALAAIEGLEITNDSYGIAVEILKERFARSSEEVISNLYSQLKRLATATNTVADLHKTYDACERIFRQLKREGEDIDRNRSLILDVMSKYPKDVLKEVSRRKRVGTHSTVSELQEALHDFIDESDSLQAILSDLEPFGSKGQSPSSNNNTKSESKPKSNYFSNWSANSTSTALAVANNHSPQQTNNTPTLPCYFCGGDHYNSMCDQYKTIDERFKQLDHLKRCRRCLSHTHLSSECRTRAIRFKCWFCGQAGSHPSPLCPKQFAASPINQPASGSPGHKGSSLKASGAGGAASNNTAALCVDEQSLLSTAVASVVNPVSGAKQRIRLILDSGSHRTYITKSLSNQLQLETTNVDNVQLAVFGTQRSLVMESSQVQFHLMLRDGSSMPINAHTTDVITNCSLTPDSLPESTEKLLQSLGDAMADDFASEKGPPDILIGSDYFWEFIIGPRMRTEEGIYIIPSSLGLILGGRYKDGNDNPKEYPTLLCLTERTSPSVFEASNLCASSSVSGVTQPYPDVDEYWSLEKIGISDDAIEHDDVVAMKQFNETVGFENGRYNVCFPWKINKNDLPTNERLAFGRFRSLGRRLATADPAVRQEYARVIEEQLAQGIIETVPKNELTTSNAVHYLPHHPVVRVGHQTTKVRIVYDASAKCGKNKLSLNECLHRGPVILPDLCAVLIRFRLNEVAVVADIEKAFLQIGLHPSERDVTRFFWFSDITTFDPEKFVVLRFARVPFGAVASPFLLGGVVQHHISKLDGPIASKINDNIYVDNVITGVDTVDQGKQFYTTAKTAFHDGGFNLREWCSNSDDVLQHIPEKDRSGGRHIKILGLQWDSLSDVIGVRANWSRWASCTTKREVLQATASVYDPLGWFQPSTMRAKCFLRELWCTQAGWDDPLCDELQQKWVHIHGEIGPIFAIDIPRHINSGYTEQSTIVVFSDASADTYAATVYLRSPSKSHLALWESNLIFAKSRLTPRQTTKTDITLPRLELLGLTIAARAAEFVRQSLPGCPSILDDRLKLRLKLATKREEVASLCGEPR